MDLVTGRPLASTAAALALVTVAGCSSGSSSSAGHGGSTPGGVAATRGSDGVQQVSIGGSDDLRFTPARITAHTGEIRITLTDTGGTPHNISFGSLGKTSQTVSGSAGQRSVTLDLSISTPGTYDFVCTFHASAGMKGRLVVS